MRRKSHDKTQLEADTVGYMPERFITGYFELVRLGLKTEPSTQQFDNESGVVKKKYRQPDGGLRDEAALRFKAWIDRQLRAMGRDMQAYLNARGSTGPSPIGLSYKARRKIARELEQQIELHCPSCKNYVSWQWAFCAWCGKGNDAAKVQEQRAGGNGGPGRSPSKPKVAADSQPKPPGRAGDDSARKDGIEAGRDNGSATSTDQGPGSQG